MSKYIDAEWLKIALELYRVVDLSEAPSIDIVRCKDCKYWRTDEKVRCRLLPYADANDFCSYGERIDNE